MTTVDVIMPARDEAPTVAANVAVARECQYVRDVILVDDCSTDGTGDLASAAGAKVITLEGSDGSKAHAMAAGVDASDADAFLFVDADCTGLTAAHLDAICQPFLEGRAVLSLASSAVRMAGGSSSARRRARSRLRVPMTHAAMRLMLASK